MVLQCDGEGDGGDAYSPVGLVIVADGGVPTLAFSCLSYSLSGSDLLSVCETLNMPAPALLDL